MKLSDLDPKRQAEIVQERIDSMNALRHEAYKRMDPIALAALELDAQAKALGIDMNYAEDIDEDET